MPERTTPYFDGYVSTLRMEASGGVALVMGGVMEDSQQYRTRKRFALEQLVTQQQVRVGGWLLSHKIQLSRCFF